MKLGLLVAATLLSSLNGALSAELIPVSVATAQTLSDAALFIADKKGYFKEEGLQINLVPFTSAANMVAPLGTGQIDVGAGSASAGLYNALLRGIKIRIVADKSSSPPGYGPTQIIVRTDLIESGRYKSPKDLKGMRFAMTGPGVSNTSTLNSLLLSAGLTYGDVTTVNLPFPDHLIALRNKSLDAGASGEPFVTAAVKEGIARVVMRDDQIDPGHQLANMFYSDQFAKRTDVADRFMRAYIRGVRFYNRSLKDGKIAGEAADEVIDAIAEFTSIKDKALLREVTPNGCDPDGRINVASLQKDLDFYSSQGLIDGHVDLRTIVDTSFVERAVARLGPYGR